MEYEGVTLIKFGGFDAAVDLLEGDGLSKSIIGMAFLEGEEVVACEHDPPSQ
jgi:hypothetical protein